MKVEISPVRKVVVLGLDKRELRNLLWCASTYGVNRLYWIDGYLLCVEVYDKSIEHELETKEFAISQVCYADLPKYVKVYEVNKGMQMPIVDVSDMKIFKNLLKSILKFDKTHK